MLSSWWPFRCRVVQGLFFFFFIPFRWFLKPVDKAFFLAEFPELFFTFDMYGPLFLTCKTGFLAFLFSFPVLPGIPYWNSMLKQIFKRHPIHSLCSFFDKCAIVLKRPRHLPSFARHKDAHQRRGRACSTWWVVKHLSDMKAKLLRNIWVALLGRVRRGVCGVHDHNNNYGSVTHTSHIASLAKQRGPQVGVRPGWGSSRPRRTTCTWLHKTGFVK